MAMEEGVAPSRLIVEIKWCCCGSLYKLRKRPSGVPSDNKKWTREDSNLQPSDNESFFNAVVIYTNNTF